MSLNGVRHPLGDPRQLSHVKHLYPRDMTALTLTSTAVVRRNRSVIHKPASKREDRERNWHSFAHLEERTTLKGKCLRQP